MDNNIGFEIDFLPVGNGDQSSDAIALRYGTPGNYKVMVYDGGTKDAGQILVNHIITYYGIRRVDYMISSHPDADHINGLPVILEQLEVGELWIHQPWKHASLNLKHFDGRTTYNSLKKHLKEGMETAYDLVLRAIKRGIKVVEPFQGAPIGIFRVLSPEENWYIHTLIPNFYKSPKQKESSLQSFNALGGLYGQGALNTAFAGYGNNYLANAFSAFGQPTEKSALANPLRELALRNVFHNTETWAIENLREGLECSGENESSVILFGKINGNGIMLTGDAGVRALTGAVNYAAQLGISLPHELNFIQIPHHGSRHNVSTTVLNRIIGPPKPIDDGIATKTAFVSAGRDSTKHPRKMVVNAFIRRGVRVFATQGQAKRHYYNMPARIDWGTATPLFFCQQVEAWED